MEVDDAPISADAKDRMKAVGITHSPQCRSEPARGHRRRPRRPGQGAHGTGKTLAYLLPSRTRSRGCRRETREPRAPNAIVFLPAELAARCISTRSGTSRARVSAALIVGGADEKSQLAAIRANARCVIGTPGRIKEFVDRGVIRRISSSRVLDEADQLLDSGFERDVNP